MENQESRVVAVYKMLFNIVNGNLTGRLPSDTDDIKFNDVADSLNDFADKLQQANFENPFITSQKLAVTEQNNPDVLIQKVRDYILSHLDNDLPSSKELAQMFGTNEFTLKRNFRNLLQTSIYQYYNDERLKRAKLLIEQTASNLTVIALLSGFNNYTNFYKAFRKKYNLSPSEIARQVAKDEDVSGDSNITT